jgi:hypothetical protein
MFPQSCISASSNTIIDAEKLGEECAKVATGSGRSGRGKCIVLLVRQHPDYIGRTRLASTSESPTPFHHGSRYFSSRWRRNSLSSQHLWMNHCCLCERWMGLQTARLAGAKFRVSFRSFFRRLYGRKSRQKSRRCAASPPVAFDSQ